MLCSFALSFNRMDVDVLQSVYNRMAKVVQGLRNVPYREKLRLKFAYPENAKGKGRLDVVL